ncbi:MAG: penicillin-binding protein 2 [Alphaproteobacteria bacterium]
MLRLRRKKQAAAERVMAGFRRDEDRMRGFSRRALTIGGLQVGLFGVLGARLYGLQVVEADRYALLAEDNRVNMRLLPPPRGEIFDRNGEPVAVNELNYRVQMVPEQAGEMEVVLARLARIVALAPDEIERILEEVGRRRSFLPVMVAENLTWNQVASVEVNAPDLPGVSIDLGYRRIYPNAAAMGHLTGYIAPPREEDLNGDPLLELPDFQMGRSGLERRYDEVLRGRAGVSQVEVNALGRVIRELTREEGQPGRDLTLTIDAGLQRATVERFGEESGAAVVMDAHTGDVLAMVSAPAYDPNQFIGGISVANWNALTDNPRAPLRDKAIAGTYSPGSTFKMVVGLAALEAGIIDANSEVWCPGFLDYGVNRFHCWKHFGHGHVNLASAIEQSCDVYFYETALELGIDKLSAFARRYGFGDLTGVDLVGERTGLMPTKGWKEATLGNPWVPGDTINAGIGQGYVNCTPLQLAVMTARLVNGGYAVTPRLTKRLEGEPAPTFPSMGIPDIWQGWIRDAMSLVVNSPSGTAYRARIEDERLAMGGKSGTVQVRRITAAERAAGIISDEDRPWHHRNHALFVAYAPVYAPRFVCGVVVEHGGGGSSTAAPIARDTLLDVQRRFGAAEVADIGPLQR